MKYGHVSRTPGDCIQIGAKAYNLALWNSMIWEYGSKINFEPSLTWCLGIHLY